MDNTVRIPRIETADRIRKAAHVYWSNTLSDVINPVTMKKTEDKRFYNIFQLSWEL